MLWRIYIKKGLRPNRRRPFLNQIGLTRVVRSRFNGPDIGAHGIEAVGPLFAFRSREHIFGGYHLHVIQA